RARFHNRAARGVDPPADAGPAGRASGPAARRTAPRTGRRSRAHITGRSSITEQKNGACSRRQRLTRAYFSGDIVRSTKPTGRSGEQARSAAWRSGSCPTGGDKPMPISFSRSLARPSRRTALAALLAAAVAGIALPGARAQAADAWPDRPIKVIVPYTPGGATDTVTRIVMDKLSARLGQNIIIENKPGANSTLGSSLAAKADPDGYTFLSMLPAYVINTHLYKLSYSPSQLEPVVHMADLPLFLFVSNDLPVKTLGELVEYGRKHPDTLTYASSGTGSSAHLTGADFALQAKLKMTHVAYKGSAPILTDLLAGRVSMVFDPVLVPMQYVKQGKLKVLAFTGKKRWPNEPEDR